MILKLEHPHCRPLLVHKHIHVSVERVPQELVSYYLRQLAIAVSHICAPWDVIDSRSPLEKIDNLRGEKEILWFRFSPSPFQKK